MKKFLATILVMCVAVPVMAVEFPAMSWLEVEVEEVEVSLGVAWYNDKYDTDELAAYIQTPLVRWEYAYIGFGGTFPLQEIERSRPHFSLVATYGIVELGVYAMASPHEAWGSHIGIRIF